MSLNHLEEIPGSNKRKVLIAVDCSEYSEFVVKWAISHILTSEDLVILVHVREGAVPQTEYSFYTAPQESSQPLTLEHYHETHQIINDLSAHLIEEKIATNGFVLKGNISDSIIAQATDSNAEMIIIGTSNENWIIKKILGSTANDLINKAPCTVIVAK